MKRPHINELTLEEKIGQLLMVAQYPLLVKVVDGEEIPRTQDEIDEIMKKMSVRKHLGSGRNKNEKCQSGRGDSRRKNDCRRI